MNKTEEAKEQLKLKLSVIISAEKSGNEKLEELLSLFESRQQSSNKVDLEDLKNWYYDYCNSNHDRPDIDSIINYINSELQPSPQNDYKSLAEQSIKTLEEINSLRKKYESHMEKQNDEIERLKNKNKDLIKACNDYSNELNLLKKQLSEQSIGSDAVDFNAWLVKNDYIMTSKEYNTWSLFTGNGLEHFSITHLYKEFLKSTNREGKRSDDWISVDVEPEFGGEYNVVYDLEDGGSLVTSTMDYDKIKKLWIDTRCHSECICNTIKLWKELPEPPNKN